MVWFSVPWNFLIMILIVLAFRSSLTCHRVVLDGGLAELYPGRVPRYVPVQTKECKFGLGYYQLISFSSCRAPFRSVVRMSTYLSCVEPARRTCLNLWRFDLRERRYMKVLRMSLASFRANWCREPDFFHFCMNHMPEWRSSIYEVIYI